MALGMHTRAKPVKRKGKEIEEVKESKRKKDKVVAQKYTPRSRAKDIGQNGTWTPVHIDHC
ncbi:hypothetical protein BGZ49_004555 [Haplosporangium sp. Z 27]|nr:hypothetical protein BGZ49_004555 [Haplosporangium sp. Z 27]